MQIGVHVFDETWLVDFEFRADGGDPPSPICLVARELTSGRLLRVWRDELYRLTSAPFSTNKRALLVAYYASAEIGCFLALGWPLPANVLDLYAEFRCMTNGHAPPCGSGLLGALAYFGLSSIEAIEKDSMRDLALRGGPWTDQEKTALLDYCKSDVDALARLLPRMVPHLDEGRSLLRGRYMAAAARMEQIGIPVDVTTLRSLRANWEPLKRDLVSHVDRGYGVYEGTTFKEARWAAWCRVNGIAWPRLESGRLALDDETFERMSSLHPAVSPIRYLRSALSQFRLESLEVGADGRSRCLLSAFRSKTGRNQPSSAKFVFGVPSWLRPIIRAEPGYGIAYVDWAQQEFGIAAALSRDEAMMGAYLTGDPYLAFAKQAGAVAADATRESHPAERALYKQCALAVQYCMGAPGLAERTGRPIPYARELLRLHRRTYPRFWSWSDAAVSSAMLLGSIRTVFGWTLHVAPGTGERTLRNFPMQANGAEMLRLACIFATERGVRVCAPVHDALVVDSPLGELEHVVQATRDAMAEASRLVLGGFELRTDVDAYPHPRPFSAERGREMWDNVIGLLARRGHVLEVV